MPLTVENRIKTHTYIRLLHMQYNRNFFQFPPITTLFRTVSDVHLSLAPKTLIMKLYEDSSRD